MPNKGEWWWYKAFSSGLERPFMVLQCGTHHTIHFVGLQLCKGDGNSVKCSKQNSVRVDCLKYKLAPKELGVWNDD